MNIELENIEARRRERQTHPSHPCPDAPIVDADVRTLIDELRRARADVHQLIQDEGDLRASAEIWCRLYEASLDRANALHRQAEQMRGTVPETVRTLYTALDRVTALTASLGAVVRECGVCARNACDAAALAKKATEACRRCAQALEALQTPTD